MDNEPDPQPPEKVITQLGVKEPPEEVLSPSDIEWEEGETSLSYVGDNGEMYTVYREPKQRYRVIMNPLNNSPWIHWSHSQRKALNKVSF